MNDRFDGVCPKCLAKFAMEASPEPLPLKPGSTFRELEIAQVLGQGGMGVVYRARHTHLGRDVALKVLSPKLAEEPEFAERFQREARAMASLSHPGIVHVHDFGREGDLWFLSMEYVEGVSLRERMSAERLSPPDALRIVGQICDALEYAHEHGVVHRDIKPENVLVDGAGGVKIADFGLAKVRARAVATLTRTDVAMGTPQYMAPEQYERMKDVDGRADIYSLGVMFYEMLTGELPAGAFAPPSQKAGVDARLDPVVLKAMAKEPERRYQRAEHLKTDVELLKVPPVPPGPTVISGPYFWAGMLAGLSLVGAVIGGTQEIRWLEIAGYAVFASVLVVPQFIASRGMPSAIMPGAAFLLWLAGRVLHVPMLSASGYVLFGIALLIIFRRPLRAWFQRETGYLTRPDSAPPASTAHESKAKQSVLVGVGLLVVVAAVGAGIGGLGTLASGRWTWAAGGAIVGAIGGLIAAAFYVGYTHQGGTLFYVSLASRTGASPSVAMLSVLTSRDVLREGISAGRLADVEEQHEKVLGHMRIVWQTGDAPANVTVEGRQRLTLPPHTLSIWLGEEHADDAKVNWAVAGRRMIELATQAWNASGWDVVAVNELTVEDIMEVAVHPTTAA